MLAARGNDAIVTCFICICTMCNYNMNISTEVQRALVITECRMDMCSVVAGYDEFQKLI